MMTSHEESRESSRWTVRPVPLLATIKGLTKQQKSTACLTTVVTS
jgi:hypothetical protein